MKRVLVLCVMMVTISAARGADIREQAQIPAFMVEIGPAMRVVAFSPDGKLLVTASPGGRGVNFGQGRTNLWNPATGENLAPLNGNFMNRSILEDGDCLGALSFSPDGKTLAGAHWDEVCLWDVKTQKLTGRLKESKYVRSMTFSADGTMLATARAEEGDVQIWGVKGEKVVATLKAKGPGSGVLAFSGDGKSLAVSYEDGTIRVWDVKAERETARLGLRKVRALAFEPGDRTVVSALASGMVCRWDFTTGKTTPKELATTRMKVEGEPFGLAFGPDLTTLAMAHERGLTICDTKTGARISNFEAKMRPGVFASSPDGKWLAAELDDDKAKPGWIQVWAVGKPADK
jgi:WD40 repeat protein